jgi:hypothetical protein
MAFARCFRLTPGFAAGPSVRNAVSIQKNASLAKCADRNGRAPPPFAQSRIDGAMAARRAVTGVLTSFTVAHVAPSEDAPTVAGVPAPGRPW